MLMRVHRIGGNEECERVESMWWSRANPSLTYSTNPGRCSQQKWGRDFDNCGGERPCRSRQRHSYCPCCKNSRDISEEMKCPKLIIHRLFSAVAQEIASNDRAQYQFLGHLFQRSNLHTSTKRRKSATRRKICVFELAHMVGDLPTKPNLTSRLQRPSTELNGGQIPHFTRHFGRDESSFKVFSAVAQENRFKWQSRVSMLGYLLRRSNLHDPITRKNSATRRKIFGFELARMVCDLPRKSNLAPKIQGYQKNRMLVLGHCPEKWLHTPKFLKTKNGVTMWIGMMPCLES